MTKGNTTNWYKLGFVFLLGSVCALVLPVHASSPDDNARIIAGAIDKQTIAIQALTHAVSNAPRCK